MQSVNTENSSMKERVLIKILTIPFSFPCCISDSSKTSSLSSAGGGSSQPGSLTTAAGSSATTPATADAADDNFVVQRGRAVPTLSSVAKISSAGNSSAETSLENEKLKKEQKNQSEKINVFFRN